jgi:multiple sugar transport system permease protein
MNSPNHQRQYLLFLSPFLVGVIVFFLFPALITLGIAFTNYNPAGSPEFNGLTNFRTILSSAYIRISIKNTVLFLITAIPLRLVGALLLALLLQSDKRPFRFIRATVMLPTFIPQVAFALICLWLFNPFFGPINTVLRNLGLAQPEWFTDPSMARLMILLISGIQLGEGFIIFLAGLQSIPRSYIEAARIDGANSWKIFWRITLPNLVPWIIIFVIRDLVFSLEQSLIPTFTITYGGPYYSTTLMPLLIYELAFDFFDFGLASATLIIFYTIMGLIVLSLLSLWKK